MTLTVLYQVEPLIKLVFWFWAEYRLHTNSFCSAFVPHCLNSIFSRKTREPPSPREESLSPKILEPSITSQDLVKSLVKS